MAAGIAGRIYRQLHDENYFARNLAKTRVSALASFTGKLPSRDAFKAPISMMDSITKTDIPAENVGY
jgi:hypothetical protein